MKSAFEKRAVKKDVKPGAIMYEVFCVNGENAEMGSKMIVTGFPYIHRGIGLFAKCITLYKDWDCHTEFSLEDRSMNGYNGYNFHAFFLTKEDAQAYIDEVNEDRLPPDMKERRNEQIERKREFEECFGDLYDY
ncbi:hypothetical protein PMMJPKLI_00098 [Klebsiella phage KP13MC5-1]|nr:hypothetical protein PMMJPKLI_00098 [Klebsiella phage KP13MC5-1]